MTSPVDIKKNPIKIFRSANCLNDEYLLEIMNMIKKNMSDKFDDNITALNNRMNRFESVIKDDLNKHFKMLSVEVNNKIVQLNNKINVKLTEVENKINLIEYNNKCNEVVIKEVPVANNNENLVEIFKSIWETINFNSTSLNNIFRLNNNIKNGSRILAKFVSIIDKQEYMHGYFKLKNELNLNRGIYINEHLTKLDHEIFKKAQELKKIKKIAKFHLRSDCIYVIPTGDSKSIKITNLMQLEQLY